MTTHKIADVAGPAGVAAAGPGETLPATAPRPGRVRRAYERGMATAEYAVGILAAVALALVLLRIVTDNSFFSKLLKFVLDIIERVGSMIPS